MDIRWRGRGGRMSRLSTTSSQTSRLTYASRHRKMTYYSLHLETLLTDDLQLADGGSLH